MNIRKSYSKISFGCVRGIRAKSLNITQKTQVNEVTHHGDDHKDGKEDKKKKHTDHTDKTDGEDKKDEKKSKFHKKKATSYDWNYDYKSSHPHASTRIGCRKYSYDANGNQLDWKTLNHKACNHEDKHKKHKDSKGSKRRNIVWDEENRIQAIYDEGTKSHYKYDFSGERIVKDTDEGEIVYVNQFYTVKNESIATKHIFAGKN